MRRLLIAPLFLSVPATAQDLQRVEPGALAVVIDAPSDRQTEFPYSFRTRR